MNKGYKLTHVILIIIFTAIISAITTGLIITSGFSLSGGTSYSELLQDENVRSFLEVYSQLSEDYYKDVDKDKIIQNAIAGMMSYLDDSYTTYLNENDANNLMQGLNGKYTGIGISIKNREVIEVFKDTPAAKSGINVGDVIISVNDVNVEDGLADITYLIKKNKDNVILGVRRGEEELTFTMKAEEIDRPSVSFHMVEGTEIGYLQMEIFASNLDSEVENALTSLRDSGMKKLIIDLRSNTGGYLEQANKVASIFLEKGKVIYYLEGKDEITPYNDETANHLEIPIVVLVNGSTASAAEILTGALKDSYGATIVGKTTYGKGKVQHTMSITGNDMIKYTSSKWLLPSKECIDEIGITPDYDIDNEYVYDETSETPVITDIIDNQLNKAIELLS